MRTLQFYTKFLQNIAPAVFESWVISFCIVPSAIYLVAQAEMFESDTFRLLGKLAV
jgi:hypothetical protein